ncbi:pyridoxamine 5'-phosphate oxidase family protein [uncultured Pontibacter sp.]|uniref:pyridoxamine 5'-phosphate oxidase family protein n=1 Tax=uncultured Pontibacter sp. TaxID=453356 RepID=UPI002633FF03|nr:pyridoxamine 5'-phosphate oxidase family protein [uncultured Pontibacter sp.]
MDNNQNTQESLNKLIDMIKDVDIAMMTTIDDDGSLRSRPMRTSKVDASGDLWFFTGYASGKSHEIKDNDAHVNLSYAKPSDELYVSVSGKATLTKDKQKIEELWSPVLKAWFPNGKDDPNVSLIRVQIEKAEYWDAPNSTLVQLYGMAKAAITGDRARPGDNEKINL